MAIILPANTLAAGGFSVDNSCRFNGADNASMSKSITSTSSTWTFSAWIKRGDLGTPSRFLVSWGGGSWTGIGFGSTEYIQYYDVTSGSNPVTTAKYRDPASWMHLVVKNNAGTITFYVNGATPAGSGGTTGHALSSTTLYIGNLPDNSADFDGYLAEVVFIDGTAYSASDFGEYDEDSPTIWKPKDVSALTFGSDGFYLDFKDSSNLGNDANGGTDLTETNIDATDQATDTPTNNFCTMSPIASLDSPIMSEGNCYMTNDGSDEHAVSTFAASNGRWYFEAKITVQNSGDAMVAGISDVYMSQKELAEGWLGMDTGQYGYVGADGKIYTADDGGTAYGDTITTNDILGVYVDLEDNKLYFSKNGTLQNSGTGYSITAAASTTGGAYQFVTGDWYGSTHNVDYGVNFGGCPAFAISSGNTDDNGYGNMEYSPNITGDGSAKSFYALNSANLAQFG